MNSDGNQPPSSPAPAAVGSSPNSRGSRATPSSTRPSSQPVVAATPPPALSPKDQALPRPTAWLSRLHNHKTFQAALAKRNQANSLQRAQPQVSAVTSPRAGTALSPKDQALPRPSASLQTTRAMAAQNDGTSDGRPPALPTFSSPVQGKLSGDFTAKRLRNDLISPSQVKQRTESWIKAHAGFGTAVVERPLQPTPITHIRQSNMQMQRDGDPGPIPSFAYPHSKQNFTARPVQLPTTQPRSPPTPPRIVLDTAISRS
jgi:hypothetical protein